MKTTKSSTKSAPRRRSCQKECKCRRCTDGLRDSLEALLSVTAKAAPVRIRKDDGKECGASHIAPSKTCHIGSQAKAKSLGDIDFDEAMANKGTDGNFKPSAELKRVLDFVNQSSDPETLTEWAGELSDKQLAKKATLADEAVETLEGLGIKDSSKVEDRFIEIRHSIGTDQFDEKVPIENASSIHKRLKESGGDVDRIKEFIDEGYSASELKSLKAEDEDFDDAPDYLKKVENTYALAGNADFKKSYKKFGKAEERKTEKLIGKAADELYVEDLADLKGAQDLLARASDPALRGFYKNLYNAPDKDLARNDVAMDWFSENLRGPTRTDAKAPGKPCGNSYIAPKKKCSKEKSKQTAAAIKKRGGVEGLKKRQREFNKLKSEVKAAKGQKPRTISQGEKLERRGQLSLFGDDPRPQPKRTGQKAAAKRMNKGGATLRVIEGGQSDKSLEDLFSEADKVGSKYQGGDGPADLTSRRKAKAKANRLVDETVGKLMGKATGKKPTPAQRKNLATEFDTKIKAVRGIKDPTKRATAARELALEAERLESPWGRDSGLSSIRKKTSKLSREMFKRTEAPQPKRANKPIRLKKTQGKPTLFTPPGGRGAFTIDSKDWDLAVDALERRDAPVPCKRGEGTTKASGGSGCTGQKKPKFSDKEVTAIRSAIKGKRIGREGLAVALKKTNKYKAMSDQELNHLASLALNGASAAKNKKKNSRLKSGAVPCKPPRVGTTKSSGGEGCTFPGKSVKPKKAKLSAENKAPEVRQISKGNVVSLDSKYTADTINDALDQINTPGAKERIAKIKAISEEQGIQAVFAHQQGTPMGDRFTEVASKLTQKRLKDDQKKLESEYETAKDKSWAQWKLNNHALEIVAAEEDSFGYTAESWRHIVVSAEMHGKYDSFKVSGKKLKSASDAVFSANKLGIKPESNSKGSTGAEGDFITYIHELGHQVEWASGANKVDDSKKPPLSKSFTNYGSTNRREQFAEHFALWVLDAERLKKESPKMHSFINESVEKAAKAKRRLDSLIRQDSMQRTEFINPGQTELGEKAYGLIYAPMSLRERKRQISNLFKSAKTGEEKAEVRSAKSAFLTEFADKMAAEILSQPKPKGHKDAIPIAPTLDAVITKESGMIRLTFAEPPSAQIVADLNDVTRQLNGAEYDEPVADINPMPNAPVRRVKKHWYLNVPEVFCINRTAESIASSLEGYGLKVGRKVQPRGEYERKHAPRRAKRFASVKSVKEMVKGAIA